MQSSSRIVLVESVQHQMGKRLSIAPSTRGHGVDVVDQGSKEDAWPIPALRWYPTEVEAAAYIEYRKAEAIVLALDTYPKSIEEFADRFEGGFFDNFPTDEASDEGLQLARKVLKPLMQWWEDASGKRKSTASGSTLAFTRFVGFMAYTINAATIARESGARLQYLRDMLVEIGQAGLAFQAEDDRAAMVVDDLLTGEREGEELAAQPVQSIELLAEDTKTEGNA